MAKPIYIVEHIFLNTKVEFPMSIGVGVVRSVMSRWWLLEKMRKIWFPFYLMSEFSRSKIFVVGKIIRPNFL